MAKGLLVNYRWCTGCHSCEVAGQVKNKFPPDQFCIKLSQIGPYQYDENKWEYTYLPQLTQQCSFCVDRLTKGKLPACVQHCQANCIQIVDAEKGAHAVASNSKVMFMTI